MAYVRMESCLVHIAMAVYDMIEEHIILPNTPTDQVLTTYFVQH